MKNINFKTFLFILIVMASISSFTFLNNVDKLNPEAIGTPVQIEQVQEVSLPDVSMLGKAADFVMDNLPAD